MKHETLEPNKLIRNCAIIGRGGGLKNKRGVGTIKSHSLMEE